MWNVNREVGTAHDGNGEKIHINKSNPNFNGFKYIHLAEAHPNHGHCISSKKRAKMCTCEKGRREQNEMSATECEKKKGRMSV